jgi:hypothetical protein
MTDKDRTKRLQTGLLKALEDHTQNEIAEATGLPQPYISAVKTGRGSHYENGATLEAWLDMEGYLDVSLVEESGRAD